MTTTDSANGFADPTVTDRIARILLGHARCRRLGRGAPRSGSAVNNGRAGGSAAGNPVTGFGTTLPPETFPKDGPNPVAVIHPSQQEWEEGVATALAALGLTWDELADQASRDDFTSSAAKALWIVVGHR
jgi:hypothetical protein